MVTLTSLIPYEFWTSWRTTGSWASAFTSPEKGPEYTVESCASALPLSQCAASLNWKEMSEKTEVLGPHLTKKKQLKSRISNETIEATKTHERNDNEV